jgi:uncharacterized protein (TIGR02145 family)
MRGFIGAVRALSVAGALVATVFVAMSIAQTGTLTDSRDGKTYKTVKIGKQTWMAQNLNYQTGGSWCYGGNNSNCAKYGRLYNWKTAKTACPTGWHLPSGDEWDDLEDAAGGNAAGKALKSASGWNNKGNGTDKYGFSALPGGYRHSGGSFDNAGVYGYWWTAVEGPSDDAYRRYISHEDDDVSEGCYDKGNAFSARCVKDE